MPLKTHSVENSSSFWLTQYFQGDAIFQIR